MSITLTPNFITYSDSYIPVLPSSMAVLKPIGATIVIPGPFQLPPMFDLDKDPRVQKQMTNFFRYKTLDKWLYDDMLDILNYFKVDDKGVRIIRSLDEYREDAVSKDSMSDIEKKVDYIEKYFLTEDTMYR